MNQLNFERLKQLERETADFVALRNMAEKVVNEKSLVAHKGYESVKIKTPGPDFIYHSNEVTNKIVWEELKKALQNIEARCIKEIDNRQKEFDSI